MLIQFFTSLKKYSWFINQTEKVNAEIKLINPNKNLIGEWADGFPVDDFFGKDYTNTLAITNNIVKCSADHARHIHTTNPTYYGMYYFDCTNNTMPIQKDFNCFINRFDIFRQSWMYQLIRRRLFDRGFISFNNLAGKGKEFRQEFLELSRQEIFELSFQKFNSIFAEEHEFIKNQIPYKNFEDTEDLTSVILASKFSIVLETSFHDNRTITYSEKIFRCLQLPRSWVLFSTQYAVENLRQLGFDVLDEIVDHSYDTIADPVKRQVAILDECEKLVAINVPDILSRCQQAVEHNKSVLKSMNDVWLINIMEDFKQAQQKLIDL
jgi:hypothetical protein